MTTRYTAIVPVTAWLAVSLPATDIDNAIDRALSSIAHRKDEFAIRLIRDHGTDLTVSLLADLRTAGDCDRDEIVAEPC